MRVKLPEPISVSTPGERFRYIFHVLVGVLELPVDRQDLLTAPSDPYFQENGYDAIIPLDARRGMYQYIFYKKNTVSSVLDEV